MSGSDAGAGAGADAARSAPEAHAALTAFSPATRTWFAQQFAGPTPVQTQTWRAVSGGANALVVAPTGSGKTLAAFLHAIDRLAREKADTPEETGHEGPAGSSDRRDPRANADAHRVRGTRVLFISPVKALAADVRKNLDVPLAGIDTARAARGEPRSGITVGMRTGDTPSSERAKLIRKPPDILVTTPESLFLMLTSRARETLGRVDTVIVDEVHSVAGTKRGSHLALSLERLDDLLDRPARRIGLSATVSPVETVAAFLGGQAPVAVVHPRGDRVPDMKIVVPVDDLGDIAGSASAAGPAGSASSGSPPDAPSVLGADAHERTGSIWPHIEASVLDQVLTHRSTIVFANSRGLAEKLTARLNELHAERTGTIAAEVLHSATGPTTGRTASSSSPDAVPWPHEPPETIARSHHGSVSKEQRLLVENELKSGALRCVVATSSLELGIDMGEVDLVIQIAAPPDVASGLQRVGRANHQVGATATGLVYPRTRRDLLESAVIVERMERGRLEALSSPGNPLDVLAQHTVSAVALEDTTVDEWFTAVRRAHPFRELTRASFESVIGMLAGRWSSEEFAGLRPQLVWDRRTGAISARPGAQRLATTNAGTIPDRGAYSVVLPEGEESAGSRRVGELDEEMVHESRVGDVITLGASSWRIQEISTDRVTVVPAPGRSARLPFWHGEGPGRPAELGEAMGAFVRDFELEEPGRVASEQEGTDRVSTNLRTFLAEQRESTGAIPSDTELVLETCPEETGDLRLILHSPYGRRVHAPWALAIGERLREMYGGDATVMAADDGIVARIPADAAAADPVDATLLDFEPDLLVRRVERLVGGSALFAARFRECAARALLLPRRDPGRRTPLWQQRLRAGQLLEAVAQFPDFPILVETARECLQDVYDLPGLQALMTRIRSGEVRVRTATTQVPSPFAGDLLFGYVGELLYEGDRPLAERRASALALDPAVLAELVGRGDAAELLDPAIVAEVEAELQRLVPGRRARGVEGVADLLRALGPLTASEVAARLEPGEPACSEPEDAHDAGAPIEAAARAGHAGIAEAVRALGWLAAAGRAVRLRPGTGADEAENTEWAAVEDTGRLRAVLGGAAARGDATVPGDAAARGMGSDAETGPGPEASDGTVPAEFLDPGRDPMGDLLTRFARTHGTFSSEEAAAGFGLGRAVVQPLLERLGETGVLVPLAAGWIHEDVFSRVRRRALFAAREAARPAPAHAYVRLLMERQFITRTLHGTDGLVRVVEQLSGLALPASLWESQVLPARVADYSPHLLDELVAAGEVTWTPAGEAKDGGSDAGEDTDPLISLHLTELASETLPADGEGPLSALQEAALSVLSTGGAWTAGEIAARIEARGAEDGGGQDTTSPGTDMHRSSLTDSTLRTAMWGLARRGLVQTDSFAAVRGSIDGQQTARRGGSRVPGHRGARRSGPRRTRGGGGRDARFGTSYSSAYRSLPPTRGAAEVTGDRTGRVDLSGRAVSRGPLGPDPDPRLRGRWSLSHVEPAGSTERALGIAEAFLDRYGVVTRAAAVAERVPGGFPVLQRVFTGLEDAGLVVRGRFVTGLGGAQFAERATVDRLRDLVSEGAAEPVVLSAADPANPFGRALSWPESAAVDGSANRPTRTVGALVVLRHGYLRAWLARGGRSLLTFPDPEALPDTDAASHTDDSSGAADIADALLAAVRRFGLPGFTLETADGRPVLGHPWAEAFRQAGLSITPRGLRFYG